MLATLEGWSSLAETFQPQPGCIGRVSSLQPSAFVPEHFMRHERTAAMPGGLIFSVPEYLPDGAYQLEIGCLHTVELFQQLSIVFDANGHLTAWERRRFLAGTKKGDP